MSDHAIRRICVILMYLAAFCIGCADYKLERRLPANIREWYEMHEVLMQTRVPLWIDERKLSESAHFLRLPEEAQRIYMAAFWEMRNYGMDDLFYDRIEVANEAFRDGGDGWRTDRGRVYILLGAPEYVRYYYQGQQQMLPSSDDFASGQMQVWIYYRSGLGTASYTFRSTMGSTWRLEMIGVGNSSNQRSLEERAKRSFAPTENGWVLWGDKLYEFLNRDGG